MYASLCVRWQDLLEGKPSGLFLLLDTQCKTPNGNEGGYVKSVNSTHAKHAFLASHQKAKLREDDGFVVKHFAGDVMCARLRTPACAHTRASLASQTNEGGHHSSLTQVPFERLRGQDDQDGGGELARQEQ